MANGRLGGRPASFADYEKFFRAEALHKFSPAEVGFQNPSKGQRHCSGCYHWFINQASGWTPCEIMHRPRTQPVPGDAVCRFWTGDGKTCPLVEIL
jgi:hypothetical protein